jgi:hypothetical protein
MFEESAATVLADSRRVCLRVDVPERLVQMTAFGLRNFDEQSAAGERWWSRVCGEMGAFVAAQLPDAAKDVRMELDAEQMEVVLGYELSA